MEQTILPDETLQMQYIKGAQKVLRALNHGLRRKIIRLLRVHQELTVTELYVELRTEQSVMSQQLRILRKEGIIKADKVGKYKRYSVDEERLYEIQSYAEALVTGCLE